MNAREIILAPIPSVAPPSVPAAFFAPSPKAAMRVIEFFTGQVNNEHTRKAYMNAARRFAAWCASRGLHELVHMKPMHVAAFIKDLQGEFSPPTVKQHLAGLRMLFDWLVTGHIIETNPAHAVRGPKYAVKKGKMPVLNVEEARALLDSIDASILIGLRDRALIAVMTYSFARINAVLEMKVRDYYTQGRRSWRRLHQKGGKEHYVPCHHTPEKYLDEYIAAAGIGSDAAGPLFRTSGRKTGAPRAAAATRGSSTGLSIFERFPIRVGYPLTDRRPRAVRKLSDVRWKPSWYLKAFRDPLDFR